MQVEPVEAPYARLLRIFSTDPQDYLDPRWQPGSTISLAADDISGHMDLDLGEGTPDQDFGF